MKNFDLEMQGFLLGAKLMKPDFLTPLSARKVQNCAYTTSLVANKVHTVHTSAVDTILSSFLLK